MINFLKLRILKLTKIPILTIESGALEFLKNLDELYLNHTIKIKLKNKKDLKLLIHLEKTSIESFRSCCLFWTYISTNIKCFYKSKVTYNSCKQLLDDIFIQILFWLFSLSGFLFNFMTFFIIFLAGESSIRIYKILIALMDFLKSLYFLTIVIVDQYYKGFYMIHDDDWRESLLCKSLGIIFQFSLLFSTFLLFLLTKERSNAIINPFSNSFIKRYRHFLIFIVFVLSLFLAIFPVLFQQV